MLRINRYIIALVVWLLFFFNIERLDLGFQQPDIANIATPVYIVVGAMVMLGLVLPQYQRVPLWRLYIVAAASFVVAALWGKRPTWGGMYTYISLFELCAVLISMTLAHRVGRLSADFVETVRGLLFSELDNRVYAPAQAEPMVKREMQYSRRANRPLSVMVLDTKGRGKQDLPATAAEIQQLLTKRHSMVALTRVITRTLRRTDFVLDRTADGRLVLVMPEIRKEQAETIISRLNDQVQRRLGLGVQAGIASFPDQGVTFEELVLQAEQDLQPHLIERRNEREGATEKLAVVEVATPIKLES
jgi:hypothetical protein